MESRWIYLEQKRRWMRPWIFMGDALLLCPVLEAMATYADPGAQNGAESNQTKLLAQHEACKSIIDAADGIPDGCQHQKGAVWYWVLLRDTWSKMLACFLAERLTRLRLAKLLLEKPDVLILTSLPTIWTLPRWNG